MRGGMLGVKRGLAYLEAIEAALRVLESEALSDAEKVAGALVALHDVATLPTAETEPAPEPEMTDSIGA